MSEKIGLVSGQTKLRNIDTPILTTFLQSPIFIPIKKGVCRDVSSFREIVVKKDSFEEITITGPLLDMNKDFPIWATVLKEVDKTGDVNVQIDENELLSRIGYSSNNINTVNKQKVNSKIENMMKVHVKVDLKNTPEQEDCTYYMNIFVTGKWDRSKKVFRFRVNDDLFLAYRRIRWKALDLDYYQNIKTDYAKALFCFYESHSDKTIPFKREKLFTRLGLDKYSRANNANTKLKKAHEHLKEIGFLKDYSIYKNNTDQCYYYKIQKVPKKCRESFL